ncbi:hypothetical protein PVMG_06012 [Plasmodium vivax Mauritania I]|uniref:PIR Superfamily Protein n=1 Tax=Plasmodium vivax Mauritania I TaxID=1035515 RepID=A0A0J9THN0_PLAVI|nr:hypothetical protein PVMG_06012 [Plasmodium vivax Mauritania I]
MKHIYIYLLRNHNDKLSLGFSISFKICFFYCLLINLKTILSSLFNINTNFAFNYVSQFPEFKIQVSQDITESSGGKDDICNDFLETKLLGYTDDDNSFKKCCANALTHITNLKEAMSDKIPGFCEYTNYWFYGKLKSIDEIKNYKTLWHKFFEDIENFDVCSSYTRAIDEQTYTNLKNLFELYENFYNFKNKSSTRDHDRCEKGEICVQDYKSHENTCKGNGNNSFCNELENFRVKFNNYINTIEKCDKIEELPSFQGPSLATAISLPVSVMSVISFFSFITYKV